MPRRLANPCTFPLFGFVRKSLLDPCTFSCYDAMQISDFERDSPELPAELAAMQLRVAGIDGIFTRAKQLATWLHQ